MFGKAVYSPLFGMEKGRENGDISVPSVWFFQRIIVLYNGLPFSFSWKLSGPENIIPDVFSDI